MVSLVCADPNGEWRRVSRFGRPSETRCATHDAERGIVRRSAGRRGSWRLGVLVPPHSRTRGLSGDMSDVQHAYGREAVAKANVPDTRHRAPAGGAPPLAARRIDIAGLRTPTMSILRRPPGA